MTDDIQSDSAEFRAMHDPLTRLPNRALMADRLANALTHADRSGSKVGFMFIDLDRFKAINDTLGHDIGDELLKLVAGRLTASVRATDTVARLGGDEFAVILEDLPEDGAHVARTVAEKIVSAMAQPIQIQDHPINTSCSIGIAVFPYDGADAAELTRQADQAMYHAKKSGRNNYQFFSAELNAAAQEHTAIEARLRTALRKSELTVFYQPRVDIASGRVTAVEALLRWNHPQRGILLPDAFLGVAEDCGLVHTLGVWLMDLAFRQVSRWNAIAGGELRISVNVSPAQLHESTLATHLEQACEASGLPAELVEFELTESMLLKNVRDKLALFEAIAGVGAGLVVDDYGVGYTSIPYLAQLPVRGLKLSPLFVEDVATSEADQRMVRASVAMAKELGYPVIAKGVERQAQLDVLIGLGCIEAQGFLIARPMSAPDFEARYITRTAAPALISAE
jgi:diguanylate cyclase (GGDEF)-like protein